MNKVKDIIMGPQCLQHFDPKLPTVLLMDVSRSGLGFILIQTETKPEAKDDEPLPMLLQSTQQKRFPKENLCHVDQDSYRALKKMMQ